MKTLLFTAGSASNCVVIRNNILTVFSVIATIGSAQANPVAPGFPEADFIASVFEETRVVQIAEMPSESAISGVYFQVQVGAFRNPEAAGRYTRFAPMVKQTLESGVDRYLVGFFRSRVEAEQACQTMRRHPEYAKAVVVAYHQGRQITLYAAERVQPIAKTTTQPLAHITTTKEPEKPRYFVRLGVFGETVPKEFVAACLTLQPGTVQVKRDNGRTEFYSSDLKNMEEAVALEQDFRNRGLLEAIAVIQVQDTELSGDMALAYQRTGALPKPTPEAACAPTRDAQILVAVTDESESPDYSLTAYLKRYVK
jgi:hypothetical protein